VLWLIQQLAKKGGTKLHYFAAYSANKYYTIRAALYLLNKHQHTLCCGLFSS